MKQTLKYIYDKLYENMKYAEGKHSIILALSSAVIAFATTFFSDNLFQNIFATSCLVFALISIIYCFCALVVRNQKPRARKNPKTDNLLDYRQIITHDEESYLKAISKKYKFLNDYKPDEMDTELTKQIISISKAINTKFTFFNFSVVFLVFSIICGIVVVLIRGNLW